MIVLEIAHLFQMFYLHPVYLKFHNDALFASIWFAFLSTCHYLQVTILVTWKDIKPTLDSFSNNLNPLGC